MQRRFKVLWTTVLVLMGLVAFHGSASALSPSSLGKVNQANEQLDRVQLNEGWLKSGYTQGQSNEVQEQLMLLKNVIRASKNFVRRISSVDSSFERVPADDHSIW